MCNLDALLSKIMMKQANNLPKNVIEIIDVGKQFGWKDPFHNQDSYLISMFKDGMRINVYYTTMTVGTCLKHPVKGKTQLFRRGVTMSQLKKIFQNPRVHTYKGYY